MTTNENINILKLYEESGINESYNDIPHNFFNKPSAIFSNTKTDNKINEISSNSSANISFSNAKEEAVKAIENINDIPSLIKTIKSFSLNPLSKFASNTITGIGTHTPKLLILTEIPTAEEDKTGQALQGPIGELVKKIIKAINCSLDSDTYTFPISFLRPAGARLPTPEEMEISIPFIEKLISLLNPQIILTMGSLPTQTLLKNNDNITASRGNWKEYNNIKLMPTFSLTQIISNIEIKKKSWEDLQIVMTALTSQST